MKLYKFGKIVHIGNNYAIVEKNQEGHMFQIPYAQRLKVDEFRKIYIYKHITEFKRNSYGFLSFKEWIFFQDLLKLAGIGPKIAFQLLEQGYEFIMERISEGDFLTLSKIPMISEKTAKQIVFQLAEKYQKLNLNSSYSRENQNGANSPLKEMDFKTQLKQNLKRLGFQPPMIETALERNMEFNDLDLAIQNCIQIISHDFNAVKQDQQ